MKDDLVVSVNQHRLSADGLSAAVSEMVRLRQACSPQQSDKEVKKLAVQLAKSYPELFVREALVADFAAEAGIQVTEEERARFRAAALKGARGLKVKDWASLMAKLGPLAKTLEERVEAEALFSAVRAHWLEQSPTNLPPDYVATTLEEVRKYNARVDATNAVIHARAQEAWEKLKAGADFAAVVAEYSTLETERNDGGNWANLDWKQVEADPELYKWAKQLEPGQYSPPIEADNGLMVMRLDRKDEKDCVMSRVFFHLPMFCTVPTPETIEKDFQKRHADQVEKRRLAALRAKAKIVFGAAADLKKNGKNKNGKRK